MERCPVEPSKERNLFCPFQNESGALHAGEYALHAGEYALHAGEYALHAGEYALHAGEYALQRW